MDSLEDIRKMLMIRFGGDEDLVQETLIRLWKALPHPNPGGLATIIAANLQKDDWAKRKISTTELEPLIPFLSEKNDQDTSKNNFFAYLLERMEDLPTKQRQVLRARYIDGLSFKQIQKKTKRNISTLRVEAKRGLDALRKMIGDDKEGTAEV